MIKLKDINYSTISLRDPVGNVFFADNRVFRIISQEYKDIAVNFLKSELYSTLLQKEWIVRTWIAEDIEKDEDSLVLEHEKLAFISSAQWSFSQWKDAAILTLNVRELCRSVGGDFRDCRPNNIAFKHGHPMMIDFGSFLYKEHVNVQYWEHLFYCTFYRTLYHMSYREPFMAHAWGEYASYYYIDGQLAPSQTLENTACFRKIYGKVIRYYDVCIRQGYTHFRVYTSLGRKMLQLCNFIARHIFQKEKVWQFFKMQAVFKKASVKNIERFKMPYYPTIPNKTNNQCTSMVRDICHIVSESSFGRIMLYGLFNIADIVQLRTQYNGTIIVASNDDIYVDKMYLAVKESKLDVSVVFYDIFMEQDSRINEAMQVDLICVQGGKNIYEPINGPIMKFFRQSNMIFTNNETHFDALDQTELFEEKVCNVKCGKLYVKR